MLKVFISQGMKGKTDEEIFTERSEAIKKIEYILGEEIEVIDSFITDVPNNAKPLWYLGKSLELLSTSDAVYFCDNWEKYRGCRIEHTSAIEYGIHIIRG